MIMLIRIAAILAAQLLLSFLTGSSEAAYPWWPFQMIAANALCIPLLFMFSRREGRSPAALFLRPYAEGAPPPALERPLGERPELPHHRRLLRDAALLIGILSTFGAAAFLLSQSIDSALRAGTAIERYAALPRWAILAITFLLPPSMALGEIPWYFGYFLPRLERRLAASGARRPALKGAALCCAAFALQHCFQPFVPDATWLALRFLVELPLIILSAAVIRILPRFMPAVLFLHGSLAAEVALKYWSLIL